MAQAIARSPYKESKVHLQRFLRVAQDSFADRLPAAARQRLAEARAAASAYRAIELYFPFVDQRASWTPDRPVQIVAILDDEDEPIAFDGVSDRRALDRRSKPEAYTLTLTAAEQPFDKEGGFGNQQCDPEVTNCDGDGGSGGVGGGSGTPPDTANKSLYMEFLVTDSDYESIFKGDPEFEVHILGQEGSTDSLNTYQCAGEHAGGAYAFDMNVPTVWSGSVLLFTRSQIDAYKSAHPGKNFRVFVVEDDDTSCQLKMDAPSVASMFTTLSAAYPGLDGAIDSNTSVLKILVAAPSAYNLLAKVAHFIATNDDLVGTAIQDSVAGDFVSGANWVIRGPGNVTRGYMKLVMK